MSDNKIMQTDKVIKKKLLKKLGININFYRNKLNLTQEDLAFDIGVDRTYISAIEQGTKSPSLYCLFTMAQRFGIDLKDLLDIKIK